MLWSCLQYVCARGEVKIATKKIRLAYRQSNDYQSLNDKKKTVDRYDGINLLFLICRRQRGSEPKRAYYAAECERHCAHVITNFCAQKFVGFCVNKDKNKKKHPSFGDGCFFLACLEGLEPPTFWFVAKHSIRLS